MFQLNDNLLDQWPDIDQLKTMKDLNTVYFERNPLWRDRTEYHKEDSSYRRKIMLAIPWIKQIDATYTHI